MAKAIFPSRFPDPTLATHVATSRQYQYLERKVMKLHCQGILTGINLNSVEVLQIDNNTPISTPAGKAGI
jgi:hypothetical protein